ncbi:DHH family phosphoesterase [Polyangium aurulentum]|nr:DHH family phosphoesterase [Polyangium aurulentum]
MEAGRALLRKHAQKRWALVPDGDVDGLSAGMLAYRALARLGAEVVPVLPGKGEHVHTDALRARIVAARPDALVVLDMGSRGGPIVPGLPTLLVDHHAPVSGFPPGATVVSAFGHPPVAATSLLAFHLLREVADLSDSVWLGLLGAVADLGTDPLPDAVKAMMAGVARTSLREAIALLNAPRRSAEHDIGLAWGVLMAARDPADIAKGRVPGVDKLGAIRAEIAAEVTRCGRSRPYFAPRAVLLPFRSGARVHPLVAVRAAARFPDRIVIAANYDYLPGRVNFAMRSRAEPDLLGYLHGLGVPLTGDSGHGHPGATGGSMPYEDFERLLAAIGFQAPPAP